MSVARSASAPYSKNQNHTQNPVMTISSSEPGDIKTDPTLIKNVLQPSDVLPIPAVSLLTKDTFKTQSNPKIMN